jgi:hypothetical protein
MFHPKGKPTPDDVGSLKGMVEVEITPPPKLKPRLGPPLEKYPYVGIRMDGMGVGTLGRLTDGNKKNDSCPLD